MPAERCLAEASLERLRNEAPVLEEAKVGLKPEGLGGKPLTEQASPAPTQLDDALSLRAMTIVT